MGASFWGFTYHAESKSSRPWGAPTWKMGRP